MQSARVRGFFGKGATLPPGDMTRRPVSPPFGYDAVFPRLTLIDQLFIIRALILRQLRLRYQKTRVGFMLAFLQPVIIILVHMYIFIVLNRYMPAHIPVQLFLIGGFTAWFTFSHTARGVHGRTGRKTLMIPCVTAMHLHIATAAWEFIANVLIWFTLLAGSAAFVRGIPPPNVLESLFVLAIAVVLGFGYELIFGTLGRRWPSFNGIKKIFLWLLFITSGIYSSSPDRQDILGVWYNPLFHLLQNERHALYSGFPIAGNTMLYPTIMAFSLTLIGLILNRSLPEQEDEH